jgi:restriction system protein
MTQAEVGDADGPVIQPVVPPAHTLIWPTVRALRELGGSGTISEITETVIELEGFSEEQQAVPAPRGNRTAIEYRLAWARTFGNNIGLLENADTGVWALTRDGQQVTAEQVEDLKARYRRERAKARRTRTILRAEETLGDDELVGEGEPEDDWRTQVLGLLRVMDPIAFERLSQRLLREAGFSNVEVTARSGDGGIDGTGMYRLSLLSFPVAFQCKRYSGAVGPDKVREFRGSLPARVERGLIITTGTFTSGARAEATRDGFVPLDLIDGDRLVDLLSEHRLGITTTQRMVYDYTVHPTFFTDI